jgi:hypothetical protein
MNGFYCYTHGIVSNSGMPDLQLSFYWAFKITIIWIFLIPLSYVSFQMMSEQFYGHKKYMILIFSSLLFCCVGFALQLIIWSPVTLSELPYLAYLFLPKAFIAYFFLVLLWIVLYRINETKGRVNSTDVKNKIKVNLGNKETSLNIEQVEYISSAGNYIEFHRLGETYLRRDTMKNITVIIKDFGFIRIHRKFIVNKKFIKCISKINSDQHQIYLSDNQYLPIGRNYRKALESYHKEKLIC